MPKGCVIADSAMFEVMSAKNGNSYIQFLTHSSEHLCQAISLCNNRSTGVTSYADTGGQNLRPRATGMDGAFTCILRFSRSNLRQTITDICGFLLAGHTTYIGLS